MIIPNRYDPTRIAAQAAFRASTANIRGYGGGMGGGKSRALCEEAFDYALDYPGILLPVVRQVHTSIIQTTRKTFMEQVLPPELKARTDLVRIKQSQGEDFVEFLWNGSQIHFMGLDNPGKVFSAEFGAVFFDEAHQITEDSVLTMNSRIRQRCRACNDTGNPECEHMPHNMVFTFNPTSPNHWLNKWFRMHATPTEWGFRRDFITPEGADAGDSIGDMEFFQALPTANPFLPKRYISQNLGGMKAAEKRRYLLGQWEHIDGSGYFDAEALTALHEQAAEQDKPFVGEPKGDVSGKNGEDYPRFVPRKSGGLEVYKPPIRLKTLPNGDEQKAHRYVVSGDVSSGQSADFSAVQVIDVDEMEQVAEWQGKVDTDQFAEIAFLIACVYNGALLAIETTGGWGGNAMKRAQKLIGNWKGLPTAKPRPYLRTRTGRLSDKFTDLVGWETQTASRALMLGALEEHVRDGSLSVHGTRTLAEMSAFAFPERMGGEIDYRKPQARSGDHDDLVMALAIGVYIATRQPQQSRPRRSFVADEPVHFSAAGY